jgi:MFS family permease
MDNITKLTLAKFFRNLAFALPIVTLFLQTKGLSLSQISWLESIVVISIVLFEIPTGILADKFGRKWSIVASSIVGLLAWIPWFVADSFAVFSLHYIMIGIAIALVSGADQAFIYDDLKGKEKGKRMQKVFGIYDSAGIISGFVAGLIVAFLLKEHSLDNFYLLFYLTVAAQVLALLIRFTLKEPTRTGEGKEIEDKPEKALVLFKEGIKLIFSNKQLKRLLLLYLFCFPFASLLMYLFQPYFQQSRVDTIWFGLAFAISSLLAGVLKIYAYKIVEWFGVKAGILILTLLPALMWGFMAITYNPILAVILFILNDGFGNMRDPIFADYFNRHIQSYNRATVLSTISFSLSLYLVVMQPILGYLADWNLSYAFAGIALLVILGAVVFRIDTEHVQGRTDVKIT